MWLFLFVWLYSSRHTHVFMRCVLKRATTNHTWQFIISPCFWYGMRLHFLLLVTFQRKTKKGTFVHLVNSIRIFYLCMPFKTFWSTTQYSWVSYISTTKFKILSLQKKIWTSATLKLKLLVCLLDTWQLYCCVSVADRPLWPPNSPMPTKCLPITNKDLTWMMSGRRFWGGVLCIPGNRTSSSRTLALFLCFIPSTETVADRRGLLV